jgi:amidase
MTELHFQSASELARRVRDREVTSRELLEHFLARVDALNPTINAVVVQDRDRARAAADAADAALARGDAMGLLHGVPMTVKESYDLAGTPTTWGIPELRGNLVATDALAVQRLKTAGAVVFGKTNVPFRLADFQSYNAIHGTTHNPWRHGATPGGSSGGAAAALAAGLTGLELGSDIGGSIRNPSHYCGVFGLKPTWNLLPMRGHALGGVLTPTDISVIGPLARSAHDLETVLRLLSVPDEIEARGLKVDLPALVEPTAGLRVALWRDDPLCPVSAAVQAQLDAVARSLAGQGAQVDEAARPAFEAAHSDAVFQGLLHSAMSARMPDAEFAQAVAQADALPAADRSPAALLLRAQTMRARDWQRLNEARTKIRWAWHRFFEHFDVLIAPVMPTTAFAQDERPFGERSILVDGQRLPYFSQIFWAGLAGVAQLPSVVVPAGLADDGLPVGVQLIGPAYGDLRMVQLAQRLEALGFHFVPPPGL